MATNSIWAQTNVTEELPDHTSLQVLQGKAVPSWTQREDSHKSHSCVTCTQALGSVLIGIIFIDSLQHLSELGATYGHILQMGNGCLLYTSDAADDRYKV